jgi:hypothetical protein
MDALLIPVFILAAITGSLLFPALLLYAIPVRAAVTLVLEEKRKEQTVLISWWPFGIRTSGTGETWLTEVLILGHAVISHSVLVEPDTVTGEPAGTGGRRKEVKATVEIITGTSSAHTGISDGAAASGSSPSGPPSYGAHPAEPREDAPVPGIPEGGGPAAGTGTGTPATASPDLGELVHAVQKLAGPVGSFGSAFWQQSRFVSATGTITLGLGDPALTGEVCGMYWASRFILLASRISVELVPVFDRAVLELDITVRVKVKHPLLVLLAGIRLGLHPAIRDVMGGALRRSRGAASA